MVELIKAIAKFSLVAVILWALVSRQMDQLMGLGQMSLEHAMAATGKLIGESALWLALSLMLIALIDVPYQRFSFYKRMMMTKQEVKDELKDMEGRPEIKAAIRAKQREMANARMMQELTDWYAQGRIKPVIDCTMPMHDLKQAYARMGSRAVRGKLVMVN